MLESATLLNIDEPIIHEPYCPIEFWNISERAASALLNTNYAMETAHFQIKVFFKIFLGIFWEGNPFFVEEEMSLSGIFLRAF
ncbi:unnamed protein product [Meloidogyne enterolobii]|uniref:Uncharacterized protein n=1 Tax=Meloidogyne enterolobii TaxID=390850 RepID=A0ACB0XZD2_MELEN